MVKLFRGCHINTGGISTIQFQLESDDYKRLSKIEREIVDILRADYGVEIMEYTGSSGQSNKSGICGT